MAQETAGTIGIPVLKNEILPYMADYQRRRDRYAALEAQREAKLADLEYKRQMEREKSVTALPGVAGNYYSGILQQMQTADLDEMQRAAKDPSVPFGALNQKGAIVKTENETRNNIANQRSKEIDETVKQAGQYGVRITPDLIGMHLSQRWGTAPTRDSRFFGESDAEQIFGKAVGDINNVNLNRLGEAMIGKSKEKIEQIETPDRKSDAFQYYDVFKPVKQKGTVAGIDVLSAGPVDIDRADAIFRSDPIASTIRDNAVKQMITANKANPNFAVLDAIQQEREAKQAFYDQVFANYKGQTKYVRSLEQGRAGRAGGGEKPAFESLTSPAVTNVTQQRYFYGPDGKAQAAPKKVTEQVDFGITETVIPKKRVNILPNKRVFVLGGNVDEAVKLGFLSNKQSDGSYILRNGFDIETYQKPKEIFRVNNKNGVDFITTTGEKFNLPNGTILTQRQAANARKKVPNLIKKETQAIRISPGTYQYSEDDMERAKKVGPVLQSLDLIISQDEIPELKTSEKRTTPKQEIQSSGW